MRKSHSGRWPAAALALVALAGLSGGATAQEEPPDDPDAGAEAAGAAGERAPGETESGADAADAAAAPAAPAPAPELQVLAEAPPGATRLDEMVVTANKRAQYLQDVPMSITAIRGKDLEKIGAKSFIDYAQTVPALNFGYYGEGRARVNIRGLQAPAGVAVVAYLVDGVAQSERPPDGELFDIDRIEILRGPQGTLYGEGAVGGAIKIITNAANPLAHLSKVSGSYGVNEAGAPQRDLNGMINVPLIDGSLGLRVVGFQRHSDGYITVREPDFDNPPGLKDYSSDNVIATNANTNDVNGGRLSLDWKARPDLAVSAKYSSERHNAGYGVAESPELEERYGPYQVTRGINPIVGEFTRADYRLASVTVNWDLPFANFESVTGAADVKEDLGLGLLLVADQNLAAAILGLPQGQPTASQGVAEMLDVRLINQWSYVLQEARFASIPGEFLTFDGRLNWVAGLFAKTQAREAYITAIGTDNLPGTLLVDENLHFYSAEYAAYGQAEWAFTPKFSTLLGARFYHADLEQGYNQTPTVYEFAYDDVSPKLTLSYHVTEDHLLYTTFAKGFRAGGANFATIAPPPDNLPDTYDPDILWSYEVGMNSVWFDGNMTVNTAAFLADWQNLQQEVRFSNNTGQTQRGYLNLGKAEARGVELETTTQLPWGFSVSLGGAYIEASMAQDITNPNNDDVIPAGTKLENQPRKSASGSLSHTVLFGGWGLTSAIQGAYRGTTHADILNSTLAVSRPYQLWNLQFGAKAADDVWSADLFCKNLFDKRASSFTFPHLDTDMPMGWRTIGLRLNYNF